VPEEALLDARGRALVDMHMKLCDLLLTRHAGTIVFPKRLLPKEKWNRAQRRRSKHVAILDKHLIGDRVASR
jgi:glutathione S-transferase